LVKLAEIQQVKLKIKTKKYIVMAKSRELFGLILGFAAGTVLGAFFMSFGRKRDTKLVEENQMQKQKIKELKDLVETVA
jgi:hypothetical protein